MNQRDIFCSNQQAPDSDNGRHVQNDCHLEPCIAQGNTSNFCRSNTYQLFPPSENENRPDLHYLSEHVSGPAFYQTTAHNQPNHPAANHPAFGVRAFHVPHNYGYVHHLPSSSSYNGYVLQVNEHGMRNYSEVGVRDLWTESTEGIPGNLNHLSEFARPSTSAAPLNSCFGPWYASMEAPLCMSDYSGYGNLPTMDVEARHRSDTVGLDMDPSMLHSYNEHSVQGYCVGQSFLPYCIWLDQQSISNAGGLPWNGPPMTPYSQGSNTQRVSSELPNSGLPVYHERPINRSSSDFLHSSPVSLQHHNHHPPYNTLASWLRGDRTYQSYDVPSTASRHTEFQGNSEAANGLAGNRLYGSQERNHMHDVGFRSLNLSRFRSMIADDVMILEGYNDENSTDHHVHSVVDNISYEDLLALSERIGTVSTGLTEADIIRQLKTRQYSATAATADQEQLPCIDKDHDSCIICQDEYEVNDQLGVLGCGHEFHIHCLKKWLLIKNVCPLCKSTALAHKQS